MKYIKLIILLFSPLMVWSQVDYFQQKVDFKWHVQLDDISHNLTVDGKINYTNNAPESLDFIYIELYANAFARFDSPFAKEKIKFGNTDFYFADENDLGGYDTISFSQDGIPVAMLNERGEELKEGAKPEIVRLQLATPLESGAQISIDVDYILQIPKSFSRLGHIDQTYQITQWYPKPAVLDNEGWHPLYYHDIGEFYGEYGDYIVDFSLPNNYVVGGTGIMDAAESAWLNQKAAATQKWLKTLDDVIIKDKVPSSSTTFKTVHFEGKNIHDFALFANKQFQVLKGQTTLASGKNIEITALFEKKNAKVWQKSLDFIGRAIQFYSTSVGDYPYPQFTAVQSALSAGAGMEYPMATVIGETYTPQYLDNVLTHEIGHSWFYSVLGSNERKNAWMDEGFNTFFEHKYMSKYYPTLVKKNFIQTKFNIEDEGNMSAYFCLKNGKDKPNMSGPEYTSEISYAVNSYYRPAEALEILEAQLGAKKFNEMMHHYFDLWQHRHPQPKDLKAIFNFYTPNVDWFFDGYINSNEGTDYALKKVDGQKLTIVNKRKIAAPLKIQGWTNDNLVFEKIIDGFEDKKVVEMPVAEKYNLIRINPIADISGHNNSTSIQWPKLSLIGGVEDINERKIYYLPLPGYNTSDGFMLGMHLTNSFFYEKAFKWSLSPMFGFKSKDLVGSGDMSYSLFPKTTVQKIEMGIKTKHFNYRYDHIYDEFEDYLKVEPYLNVTFTPSSKTNGTHSAHARWVYSQLNYITGINVDSLKFTKHSKSAGVAEFGYNYDKKNGLGKTSIDFDFRKGQKFALISGIYKGAFAYENKRFVYLRAQASHLFLKDGILSVNPTLTGTGRQSLRFFQTDYMFDETLISRNISGNIFNQQIYEKDAFLKTLANNIRSNSYMISLGLSMDIPIPKVPIQLYADGVVYPDLFTEKAVFDLSSGLSFSLLNKNIQVFFPVVSTKRIRDNINIKDLKYFRKVTFKIDINALNFYKVVRKWDEIL